MLEGLVVAVIVAAAFVYAGWALIPAATRLRLARRLVAATGGKPAGSVLARLASRLEQAAGGGSHCTGCDAHPAPPPAQSRRPK
jgi:hypothetical protein